MIDLYTAATPNGYKVSIALEELGLPYTVHALKLGEREQHKEWFRRLNPNARIPVIMDRDADDFVVWVRSAQADTYKSPTYSRYVKVTYLVPARKRRLERRRRARRVRSVG